VTDLALEPIEELAPRIARREISPVELVQAVLVRVEALDPVLRAYVTVDADRALAAARQAEVEIGRSGSRTRLHGIPVAVKDNIAVAGLPATIGSPLMADHVPSFDAAAVERLRAAGAIVLGKAGLHEWAMGGTCIRQPGGPIRNPWDVSRVPGGSSGGSAVAVAAGLAIASLGTDGMGSIRTPASYCGVVGLKPTSGRVSRFGVLPPTSSGVDSLGPIARTVGDVRLLLEILTGHDGRDPTSVAAPSFDAVPGGPLEPRRLRVGLVESPLDSDVLPAVRAAVNEAALLLEAAGAEVGAVRLPTLGVAPLLAAATLNESQSVLLQLALDHPDGFANPDIRYRILASEFVRAADVRRARQLTTRIRTEVADALAGVDVLLLPTNSTTAFPIDAQTVLVGGGETVDLRRPGGQARITTRLTLPFNVAGVPVVSLPAPTLVDGLPVGLQLVGRRWQDERLLEIASLLEAAGARYRPPRLASETSPSTTI
jgi:aspartyl-tRNA(Asn)/glutamyl-tRNA(Gln) amidotransferase subunit A